METHLIISHLTSNVHAPHYIGQLTYVTSAMKSQRLVSLKVGELKCLGNQKVNRYTRSHPYNNCS